MATIPFPKNNSVWTSLSGHDVTVQGCCNTSPAPVDEAQIPQVIFIDHQGNLRTYPLERWKSAFRPSVTQTTINATACTAWQLAITTASQQMQRLWANRDISIDESDFATINEMFRHVGMSGQELLLDAGLATSITSSTDGLFRKPYLLKLAGTYDAMLRATPAPGALFTVELLRQEQAKGPVTEQEFYVTLVEGYWRCIAEREHMPVEKYSLEITRMIQQGILDDATSDPAPARS